MIEVNDLRKGLVVWWTADRGLRSWSCPCVVINVTKGYFKVKTFDDFKESESLRVNDMPVGDKSCRHEMVICSKERVAKYLQDYRRKLSNGIAELRHQADSDQIILDNHITKGDKLFKETFPE